jgi:chaperonin GroES
MKATLQPFYDNLILEAIEAADRTSSGIIIPEAHRVDLSQGKVIDKGPLVSDSIKLGDIVFYAPHSETRIAWRGNKYRIVAESNCLGRIREEESEPHPELNLEGNKTDAA